MSKIDLDTLGKQVLNFDISMAVTFFTIEHQVDSHSLSIYRLQFQCSGTTHYSVVDFKEIRKPVFPNVYKYNSGRCGKITIFSLQIDFLLGGDDDLISYDRMNA